MTVIAKGTKLVTFINVFTVAPVAGRCHRTVAKNVLGEQLDAAGIVARAAPGRSVVKKRVG
jgi:hypothetical protein